AEVRVRGAQVLNSQRRAALFCEGQPDHALRDVHPGEACPAAREDPRVVPFSASRVEDLLAAEIAGELQEGRVVQELAGDVVTLADFAAPRLRVLVPVAGDVFFGKPRVGHGPRSCQTAGRAVKPRSPTVAGQVVRWHWGKLRARRGASGSAARGVRGCTLRACRPARDEVWRSKLPQCLTSCR